MSAFQQWTCVFPGKMGISWKRAWDGVGTKEEAEEVAKGHANVIAIPLSLYERYKEYEGRMVVAERDLQDIKTGKIVNDISEMIISLHTAIIQAGGGGLYKALLDGSVKDMITHLASNKIRFKYVGE